MHGYFLKAVCIAISSLLLSFNTAAQNSSSPNSFSEQFSVESLGVVLNTFSLQEQSKHGCFAYSHEQNSAESTPVEHSQGKMQSQIYASARDLAQSAGIDANASVGYGIFSAEGKLNTSASTAATSTGVVATWMFEVYKKRSLRIPLLSLTDMGKQSVDAMNKAFDQSFNPGSTMNDQQKQAVEQFYKNCGQAIITSVEMGNHARMNIDIKTSSKEIKSAITGQASGEAGSFTSLSANMRHASQSKQASFELHAKIMAEPYEALTISPSKLTLCQWNATTNNWNEYCNEAIAQFDKTVEKLNQRPELSNKVIRFPGITATHEINDFLTEPAKRVLNYSFRQMRERYEYYSLHYLLVKQQYDVLERFLSQNVFATDSRFLSEQSVQDYINNVKKLKSLLSTVTNVGFLSEEADGHIRQLIAKTTLDKSIAGFSDQLQNNPMNTLYTPRIDANLPKDPSGGHNQRFAVAFPKDLGNAKIAEIVINGKRLTGTPQTGVQLVSAIKNFCTYDFKPNQTLGYMTVKNNDAEDYFTYPFVIHSLRWKNQEERCLISLDQNISKIDLSIYEKPYNKANPKENGFLFYDNISLPFNNQLPLNEHYWASISDLTSPYVIPGSQGQINVLIEFFKGFEGNR